MDHRLHHASSSYDPAEVRRVLLSSSPSELLLILSSEHILRPDVEHLIAEKLIADPRLEPPQLEQLENGSVVLPDGRHLLRSGEIISVSPVNNMDPILASDSEPAIASNNEPTQNRLGFTNLWSEIMRKTVKLKKAVRAIKRHPGEN